MAHVGAQREVSFITLIVLGGMILSPFSTEISHIIGNSISIIGILFPSQIFFLYRSPSLAIFHRFYCKTYLSLLLKSIICQDKLSVYISFNFSLYKFNRDLKYNKLHHYIFLLFTATYSINYLTHKKKSQIYVEGLIISIVNKRREYKGGK